MSVVVRLMSDSDRAALVDLKWELNKVEIATMPDTHPLKGDRDPAREAAERGVAIYETIVHDGSGEVLVAEDDGKIVGSIVWYVTTGSPSLIDGARRRAMIAGFVVSPGQRGKGLGKRLLEEVERRARNRGLNRLVLGVVAWNEPSIAFYEAQGFSPLELIMSKRLDGDG